MKKLSVIIPVFFIWLSTAFAEVNPLFSILDDGTGNGTAPNACSAGASPSGKQGLMAFTFRDGSGNLILPQLGQKTMANSHSVVVASDQVVPVMIKPDQPLGKFVFHKVISPGTAYYQTYPVTQNMGIKNIIAGGDQNAYIQLAKYTAATVEFVPGGGFNSTSDIAMWTNTGVGDSSALTLNRDTTIFDEGTSSVRLDHTKSGNANYVQISYTWVTPKDFGAFRYLYSRFYNVRPAGGNTNRTISLIMTDLNGLTRTFSITGSNAIGTVPFGNTGWITLGGEIKNPTSNTTGFDVNNVSRIDLRMNDGANRAGSVYWDNVRFEGAVQVLFRAFFQASDTFQTTIDPVETFSNGETLTYIIKNNGATAGNFSVYSTGVAL